MGKFPYIDLRTLKESVEGKIPLVSGLEHLEGHKRVAAFYALKGKEGQDLFTFYMTGGEK